MKIKLLVLLLAVVTLLGSTAAFAGVSMCSPTGSEVEVDEALVDTYIQNGWLEINIDGMVTLYSADGRTLEVMVNQIEDYEKVGWYKQPLVTMYAADGRTLAVMVNQVEDYEKVGWYKEPLITMYAAGGRTINVPREKIEAYKNVGWYETPVVEMYAADGRVLCVREDQVEEYKKVGWYQNIEDVTTWMYSLTDMEQVPNTKVNEWLKAGWSTEMPPVLFSNVGFVVDSYDWVSYGIAVVGLSEKRIKYIDYDIYFYNIVGDPVKSYTGKYYIHNQIVGFVDFLDAGTTVFEDFTRIHLCGRLDFKNIKITYEDGSVEWLASFFSLSEMESGQL